MQTSFPLNTTTSVLPTAAELIAPCITGNKFFETKLANTSKNITSVGWQLSNHLGNVLVTISDRKVPITSTVNTTQIAYFEAAIETANDYYPFGMTMPSRSYSAQSVYRYGFNGQEKSDEIFEGSTTALFWHYDARSGRRWNVDPIVNHSISSYATNEGNPIKYNDPNGDCATCGPPTVNASVAIKLGSHNKGVGFKLSITQKIGNFNLSVGIGVTQFTMFSNTGKTGTELRGSALAGYDDGKNAVSLGTNVFKGLGGMKEFKQRTGILNLKFGDFRASYENDGTPFDKLKLGDGNDSYRTAAVKIGIGDFATGFNLFTGQRLKGSYESDKIKIGKELPGNFGEKYPNGFVIEHGNPYRMGGAFVEYIGTKIGIESDRFILYPIQTKTAHNLNTKLADTRQGGFKVQSVILKPFYERDFVKPLTNNTPPNFTLH